MKKFSFLVLILMSLALIQGKLAGISIQKTSWSTGNNPITGSRVLGTRGLSGSTYHSLAYTVDVATTLTVEAGVQKPDGTYIYAEIEDSPFVLGIGSGILPLTLPVADQLRVTAAGTGLTALVIISDS